MSDPTTLLGLLAGGDIEILEFHPPPLGKCLTGLCRFRLIAAIRVRVKP